MLVIAAARGIKTCFISPGLFGCYNVTNNVRKDTHIHYIKELMSWKTSRWLSSLSPIKTHGQTRIRAFLQSEFWLLVWRLREAGSHIRNAQGERQTTWLTVKRETLPWGGDSVTVTGEAPVVTASGEAFLTTGTTPGFSTGETLAIRTPTWLQLWLRYNQQAKSGHRLS